MKTPDAALGLTLTETGSLLLVTTQPLEPGHIYSFDPHSEQVEWLPNGYLLRDQRKSE